MKNISRRAFGQSCVALAAASFVGSAAAAKRVPLSFSTLGCPEWDWKTIVDQAQKMGYSGVEIRGIKKQMELSTLPEFSGTAWKQSLAEAESRGLKIVDLGASTQLHERDPQKRAEGMDSAKKFIDLAHNLKCPNIRVFGNNFPADESREATMERVVKALQELGTHAKGSGVTVLVETHGDFNKSTDLLALMKAANMPEVGVLWDAHHTFVAGGEQPAETWKQLHSYIRHAHLKDSKKLPNAKTPDDIQYVLFGEGEVPVKEQVRVLKAGGYKGFYNLEWEKGWHPELAGPEVVFPQFVQKVHEYLQS